MTDRRGAADDEDWLDLRTAALARPREGEAGEASESNENVPRLSVLLVIAAGGAYAIDLRWLRGVRTLRRLARLPLAPPHVAGLVAHEGAVLPVFYLAAVLGTPLAALPERGQALVLGREGDLVAVAVDEVGETRELLASDILPPPASLTERLRSILIGVTREGLLLLDTGALLAGGALVVEVGRRAAAPLPAPMVASGTGAASGSSGASGNGAGG